MVKQAGGTTRALLRSEYGSEFIRRLLAQPLGLHANVLGEFAQVGALSLLMTRRPPRIDGDRDTSSGEAVEM